MDRIAASPDVVSKLKKAAKLRVRSTPGLSHAQALDEVAFEAGFLHWKGVTTAKIALSATCTLDRLTARTFVFDPNRHRSQELVVIVGRAGAGKTLRAHDYALNALRQQLPVHILDFGSSYRKLFDTMGGTFAVVGQDGSVETKKAGKTPLFVLNLDHCSFGSTIPRPESLTIPFLATGAGLLIIDEVRYVSGMFPGVEGLSRIVGDYLECGGSVLMLAQDMADVQVAIPAEVPRLVHKVLVNLAPLPPV